MSAVLVNNHTAIWGSWYDPSTGSWGYACCQSDIHMSYCSGLAGIEAAKASIAQNVLAAATIPTSDAERPRDVPADAHRDVEGAGRDKVSQNFSKKRVGEGDVTLDKERLAQAINDERKRKMKGDEDEDRWGKKTRTAIGGSHDVTEEELGMSFPALDVDRHSYIVSAEAYRMSRRMGDDPMAHYIDTED